MYLILEENEIIDTDNIIGIFDLDKTTVNKRARDYINEIQKREDIITINNFDLPKSFVVLCDNKVILSKLLTSTIKNRMINYEKK